MAGELIGGRRREEVLAHERRGYPAVCQHPGVLDPIVAIVSVLAQTEGTDGAETSSGLPWYAYLFWLWFLIALGAWIYRGYLRFTQGPKATRDRATATADESPARRTGLLGRAPKPEPIAPPTGPSPTEALFLEAKASRDRDNPGPQEETGSTGRSGFFAGSAEPTPAKPVATLLQGIAMPCDLAPVIDAAAADPTGHRVAFHTTGFDPGEVGRRVGDELERLGFTLRSLSATEIAALRDDDRLEVTLHPMAGKAQRDGSPAYPSLPPTSVVVEFRS
jgi:hypothetical protein